MCLEEVIGLALSPTASSSVAAASAIARTSTTSPTDAPSSGGRGCHRDAAVVRGEAVAGAVPVGGGGGGGASGGFVVGGGWFRATGRSGPLCGNDACAFSNERALWMCWGRGGGGGCVLKFTSQLRGLRFRRGCSAGGKGRECGA